jgi:acyl-CoA reductase-like NAD-dependent aldehyde dehydrogenase
MPGPTSWVRREPIGIVGAIVPCNYPLLMAVYKLGPALATGNMVVLQPSELTPLSALRFAELALDVLPPGVLNVVTGEGASAGAAVAAHPEIRLVALTGDVATGRTVARRAFAEARSSRDLQQGAGDRPRRFRAEGRRARDRGRRLWNSGQDCLAACRVIAALRVHDELLDALAASVAQLRDGDPAVAEVDIGPVISATQKKRVLGFVAWARREGARQIVNVQAPDGQASSSRRWCSQESTRTPKSCSERSSAPWSAFSAWTVSARHSSGPTASPTGSARRSGHATSRGRWTSRVTCASARYGVNEHGMTLPELPHGGRGESGHGTDLSIYSLAEHTELKHVMVNLEDR